ncbi:NACHT domain-containing protein [Acinetobacter sp. TSRC1-2]|uniref:NACHT domain-containing protein n=1 Tax=unclassified Acinetobacter TaxID=196816 RepID=UPI003CECC12D
MAEPLSLGIIKVINKPLNDLYDYLKQQTKFHLEKQRLNDISGKIELKIENIKKVKTIYKGDEAIDLNSFYYPPYIDSDQGYRKADSISDITSKNFVIEGVAGQGKSILLRYLSFKEYEGLKRIPIFIELRKINKEGEILGFIKEAINSWVFSVSDELLDWVLKSGKIVLLLDGFDELKAKDVPNVIKDLEGICQQYPMTQIVISSRPDNAIQSSNYFKVLCIRPYKDDERIGLTRKLVEDDDAFNNLLKALKESPLKVDELLSTPLMVTLFVMTYRAKLVIPDSMSKFYEELFSVLIYKHDRTKPGYQREFKSNLNESELQEWFETLCFISKNNKTLVFENRQALLACIRQSILKRFQQENPSALLEDVSKNLCLIIRDGNNYSFIHRSIQEFFVASFFKKRPQDLAERTYNLLNEKSSVYKSEISFLSEIDNYRFKKYLFRPALETFFEIFPTFLAFKSCIHVDLHEDWEIPSDDEVQDGYDGELKKYVELTIKIVDISKKLARSFNSYLYTLIYEQLISKKISTAVFINLGSYGVNRFLHSIPVLDKDIEVTKVTKYFRKEANQELLQIYNHFQDELQQSKIEINQQEDQSFLDLI